MKTDNKRLSELVQEANKEISKRIDLDELTDVETAWLSFADCLISKGVTIPVRCGECKHWSTLGHDNFIGECVRPLGENRAAYDDDLYTDVTDFCSFGEREEDD